MKKILMGLAASFLLAGCALSPQEVQLAPKVVVEKPTQMMSSSVSVTVYDERISNVLGNRGGVYGDTNAITTSANLPASLKMAVSEGLSGMGVSVEASEAVTQFQVYLDELDYTVPEGSYITKVDLSARIRVVVMNASQRFEGSYTSSVSERVPSAPSDEKNEALINAVMGDVLTRALEDKRLQQFLGQ